MTSTVVGLDVRDAHLVELALFDLAAQEAGLHCTQRGGPDELVLGRVATCAGQVTGFARTIVSARTTARLDAVFVFGQWRRRGSGRALVEDACRQAQQAGAEHLDIVAQPWAEAFFRRLGARRIGSVPPDHESAWSRPWFRVEIAGSRGPVVTLV